MKLTTSVADAIINDNSDEEEEILHRDFRWETTDNLTVHREVFSCDFGHINGAENVSDIVQCFELYFDKEIIQQIGWSQGALAPGAYFKGVPKRQSPTGHTLIRSTIAW
jgi:hypothetical protein